MPGCRRFRFLGDVSEVAFAFVVKQDVLPLAGDEDIVVAVVVVVADGDTSRPNAASQAGLRGDVFEGAVAVVVIEPNGGIRGSWRGALPLTGEDDDIHPAVVVVIDESGAAAHGFEHVVDTAFVTVDDGRVESGLLRDVYEAGVPGESGSGSACLSGLTPCEEIAR